MQFSETPSASNWLKQFDSVDRADAARGQREALIRGELFRRRT